MNRVQAVFDAGKRDLITEQEIHLIAVTRATQCALAAGVRLCRMTGVAIQPRDIAHSNPITI